MNNRSILIAGAGIAGPALAYWLSRWGFEPVLVEHAPAPRTSGYMIDFWGVGFDVAERMGLLPVLLRDGYRMEEVRLVDARGARVGGFDGRVFRSATNDRFISLPRSDLAECILATVAGELEILFADGVQALQQDDHGVDVTFDGSVTRRFDLVIGADGLHSAVRATVFGEEYRFEKHLGYSVAAFNAAGYPHRDENVYVSYNIPGRQVARYSLRNGSTGFVFIFADDAVTGSDPHHDAGHKSILRRAYGDAGWECRAILDAMDSCDDLYFDRVSQIRMDRWFHRRVALVGDAGFCPSLLAGEGAALAMAGAYVLAGELKAANGEHETAFEKYQACFKAFVDQKQAAATQFGGWFAPRTRFGIRIRNMTTRLFAIPFVADWMTRRFIGDRFRLPDYSE